MLLVVAIGLLVGVAGCVDATPDGDSDDPGGDGPDDGAGDTDPADDANGDDGVPPAGSLELHHIDVGQADATLIVTPAGETILIDSGDWRQDGSTVLAYLDEQDIDRLDHLVATHAHADHIGGHATLIEEFETNRDGIGAIYRRSRPSASGLDPEGEGRKLG